MIFLRLLPAHSAKLHRTPNSAQLFLAIAVHHKQCAVLLSLSLSFHYSVSIKTFAAVGLYMKTSCSLVASSVVLAWQGNSYVESYVYIWLDGAYKIAVRASAGSATVSVRASGSHTVVLKDGNTSTATAISNTISVTVPENAS